MSLFQVYISHVFFFLHCVSIPKKKQLRGKSIDCGSQLGVPSWWCGRGMGFMAWFTSVVAQSWGSLFTASELVSRHGSLVFCLLSPVFFLTQSGPPDHRLMIPITCKVVFCLQLRLCGTTVSDTPRGHQSEQSTKKLTFKHLDLRKEGWK